MWFDPIDGEEAAARRERRDSGRDGRYRSGTAWNSHASGVMETGQGGRDGGDRGGREGDNQRETREEDGEGRRGRRVRGQ